MTPSPFSRLATALVSGLVSTAAQTFAGAKTFTAAIIASAGVQLSALWNTNGSGASDVCVKVGTSEVDANVNSGASIWSARTGIGGTEVVYAKLTKAALTLTGALYVNRSIIDTGASGFPMQFIGTSQGFLCDTSSGIADGSALWLFRVFGTNKAIVYGSGMFGQRGDDSSGTPGSRTGANAINKPSGKSAIASGQATCQIDNNLVAAGDQVHITWHGDHGQIRDWVTTAAGSFTVNLNAAAAANTAFCWTVAKRL